MEALIHAIFVHTVLWGRIMLHQYDSYFSINAGHGESIVRCGHIVYQHNFSQKDCEIVSKRIGEY